MDFKLTTRRADSIFIIDLAGKFTAGDALTLLRQTIRDEMAKGHNKILQQCTKGRVHRHSLHYFSGTIALAIYHDSSNSKITCEPPTGPHPAKVD